LLSAALERVRKKSFSASVGVANSSISLLSALISWFCRRRVRMLVGGFFRSAQEFLVGIEANQALRGAVALAEAKFSQLLGHEGG